MLTVMIAATTVASLKAVKGFSLSLFLCTYTNLNIHVLVYVYVYR